MPTWCNVSLARIQPVHEEKLKNKSGDVDKLQPEMATSQHSTGTQQSYVALQVPNDKLDRFCRKQRNALKQNNIAYHLEPVSPPGSDGSHCFFCQSKLLCFISNTIYLR